MQGFRIVCVLCVTTAVVSVNYLDGPPLGNTGGFGEPTCASCHFGNPINSSQGKLELLGIGNLQAGETTGLTVELTSAGLLVGGFQMTARARSGESVGVFRSSDINSQVLEDSTGIQYIQHTRFGTENALVVDGTSRWALTFEVPLASPDTIVINIAANASNGDNSALGDKVFTTELAVPILSSGLTRDDQ